MLYIICILRILRVNFAKQMHQNLWYGMFALMSVCDICNLASWQCWIPTGKSVSLLEISHKIMLLVSAFLLELEHLIYRVYKKNCTNLKSLSGFVKRSNVRSFLLK